MTSIYISGAAGAGKTTLSREFMQSGFVPSPNHLSRPPRLGEVHGVDAWFVDRPQFERNFGLGMYLEESLTEAEYLGAYYGSPRHWVDNRLNPRDTVSVPANVNVLEGMLSGLPDFQRSGYVWVNLFASTALRRDRLSGRITDPSELEARLHTGVSHGVQSSADLNVDTGVLTPERAFELVSQHIKTNCL